MMRKALSIEELKSIYGHIAGRYDSQHAIITAKADQKGRKILVEKAVTEGDNVLDCGSGTGTTGIFAAKKTGTNGKVTMFDLSDAMLAVARAKVIEEKLQDRVTFQTGDMVHLPFDDRHFIVDECNRPMFHFSCRVTFGMDIGYFFELQSSFEGNRE